MESNVLSFAKLRGGWAKVGSDTGPYALDPTLSFGDGWNASTKLLNLFVPNNLPNAQLNPEFTTSIEIGADFRFLQDRINLDVTYYDMSTTDQIINIPVSAATGFTSKSINAGEITNKGWEIMLGADIIKASSGFNWNVSVNWAKNTNEVVELAEGIEQYELGTYWSLKVVNIPGMPYGQLYGYDVQRAPDGQIIHASGLPKQGDLKALGTFTPDWIGGITNTFSYKNLDLSVLIDTRQGGSMYSMTTTWGRYAGVLEETLIGREGGIVGDGVKADGDGGYVTNDVVVTAEQYNKAAFVNSVASTSVFDASYVKLREVRLGYNFRKVGSIKNLKVAFVGRNLALLASEVPHVDPETAFSNTNVQGLEFGQLPSARSLGFNISLDF
jgi:outer membrane receptor protein involved in Fe transport